MDRAADGQELVRDNKLMHLTLLAHMLRLSFRSSESAYAERLVSVLSHVNEQQH